MRMNSMKAQCFKMLDDRQQTTSATLVIEIGVTLGTANSYRTYYKRQQEGLKRQKEAKRKRRH